MPYTYAQAITLRQQFGLDHAARWLAKAGCPLNLALAWLL